MILYLNAPTAASPSFTFTTRNELITAINQNQNSSGAIYQIEMQANNVRLLHIAITRFKQLRIIHPKNPLLEAGEGFSKFMEVGPCSYWTSVSEKLWPNYVTTMFKINQYDKAGPFQSVLWTLAGCSEIHNALQKLPHDPYLMLMDTIANGIATAPFQDTIGIERIKYRHFIEHYLRMMQFVIKKLPDFEDANGFYGETLSYLAVTYYYGQSSAYHHYTSLELNALLKTKNASAFWYNNIFVLDISECYDILNYPHLALIYYRKYMQLREQVQSRSGKYQQKGLDQSILPRLEREIKAEKDKPKQPLK